LLSITSTGHTETKEKFDFVSRQPFCSRLQEIGYDCLDFRLLHRKMPAAIRLRALSGTAGVTTFINNCYGLADTTLGSTLMGAWIQMTRTPDMCNRTSICRRLLQLATSSVLAGWTALSFAAGIPTADVRHLFDITGQGAGGLSLPTDVAVSNDGRIYIVDGGNHRIVGFDRNGKHFLTIGSKGSGNGQFKDPVGIGTDGKGRVYVADTGNHRIQVFGADGRFQYGFPVADSGLAIRPIDVAADATGSKIYVSGNNNHKIMEFAAPGRLVRQWGGNGESGGLFRYPASVAISTEGDVYIADALNSRVQGFDIEGKLLIQVGTWGVLPGQLFRPKGVAIDGKQAIYISDSYMDVIQVYDGEGRFMHVLGHGGKPQRFVSAGGITIGPDNRLYTAEILRNKVSVYSLDK
jgi:DNA-binding beta-propeller fold protein YncE